MTSINIISSFATDTLVFEKQRKETFRGGPARWILDALKKSACDAVLYTGNIEAQVEIQIIADKEKGTIVTPPGEIKIHGIDKGDATIISTLLDEFNPAHLNKITTPIALDVQGYVRKMKSDSSVTFPFTPEMYSKISIVKSTLDEAAFLPQDFIQYQKNRVYIETNGSKDVRLFVNAKESTYRPERVDVPHAVGAGDTFLASFVYNYVLYKDAAVAMKKSMLFVNTFLLSQKRNT